MPILVQYKDVDGESTISGYEKYFEVTSFQFGVGRGIKSASGQSTREGNIASVSEIVVTKESDGASLKLFQESLMGKLDKTVKIAFVRTGGDVPKCYLRIELEGCGISGFSMSAGGDRPTESLSLNFDKITMFYNPVGDGLGGNEGNFGWNLATGAKA
jgi:type VI secretion system secreted protein Hcp